MRVKTTMMGREKYASDEDYTKWCEWLEQEQDLEFDRKKQMYQ